MGRSLRTAWPMWLALLAFAFLGLVKPATVLAQPQNFEAELEGVSEDDLNKALGRIASDVPGARGKLTYDPARRRLKWSERNMDDGVRSALRGLLPTSAGWASAIDRLYNQSRQEFRGGGSSGGGLEKVIPEDQPLALNDYPLVQLMQDFAREFGLNIVCSKDVDGNVSMSLKGITVDIALKSILRSQGFEYQVIESEKGSGRPDVLLIVKAVQRPASTTKAVVVVEKAPLGKVEIEFEELVKQISGMKTGAGRIVANADARVILIEDVAEAVTTMQEYLDAVRKNLPDAEIGGSGVSRQPVKDPKAVEPQPQQPAAEKELDKLYRISGRETQNTLDGLTRILGAAPRVISERDGIVMITETEARHKLVDDYLAKVAANSPPPKPIAEQTDTRVYTLKQEADTIAKAISPFLTAEKGKIVVNSALNSLIVTDLVPNFAVLERYVRELDAAPTQVLIESTVLEATLNDQTDFGLSAFWQRGAGSGTLGYQSNTFNPTAIPPGVTPGPPSAISPFRSFSNGSFNFGFLKGSEWEVAVNALNTTRNANILSRPKMVIANNKEGLIKVGTEIPYVSVQGGAAGATQGVQFKPITLELKVTPHIEPGDRIRLQIDFRYDNQTGTANLGGAVGGGQPIVSSRQIKTEVYVNDGETLVIGGMYEERANDTVNKVPVLGDLPVIGQLFRQTNLQRQKTDLLFIITPSIVRDRREVTVQGPLGRTLKVYRPDAPQIPDWYKDDTQSRLRDTNR